MIAPPPHDVAAIARGLTDELVAQYVNKIESQIGTTINQAAFAQVTGANN